MQSFQKLARTPICVKSRECNSLVMSGREGTEEGNGTLNLRGQEVWGIWKSGGENGYFVNPKSLFATWPYRKNVNYPFLL